MPGHDEVCAATSLELKAQGSHRSIICALQMGCCSVAGAKHWMRAARCWQGTPCSVLLGSPTCRDAFCWSCFLSQASVCFLYRSAGPILGAAPEPLCFPKGFSLTLGLSLQQPLLFLSRNTVVQTNLFISGCFFSCADLDIEFPLRFISASHLDPARCWVWFPHQRHTMKEQ